MNHRLPIRFFLLLLVSLTIFSTSPAPARIWPPCQGITYTVPTVDSVSYSVTDPVSGQAMPDTWTLTQGAAGQRFIESLWADQGIFTWIAKYKNAGEVYYTYEVHYRIYDPGRGFWKAGSWGPFGGYNTSLENYVVKDGVVAWTAHRTLGAGPNSMLEHQALCVTYDPKYGSWPLEQHTWQVPSTSAYRPKTFLVKNGVVAWSMKGNKEGVKETGVNKDGLFATTYDQESHFWNSTSLKFAIETIEIPDETAQVRFSFSFLDALWTRFLSYDSSTHQWNPYFASTPLRRAFFVAQPDLGVVPLRVWFWDCSTSFPPLASGNPANPYEWNWFLAPGVLSAERSPTHLYTTPGQYDITENVTDFSSLYPATGQITAQPANPTGSISINNGAAYTSSANVTLSLGYSADATEMCFRQSPGWLWWSPWQPVAASCAWTLSTLHLVGESPDGPHYVRVKYRDQSNHESPEYQAAITLDLTPPAVTLTLNNGEATTRNPTVKVSWSGSDAIGIAQMSYTYFDQGDPVNFWHIVDFSPPVATYRPRSTTIKFSSKPGRKTVMVRLKDVAGNITHTQASIQLQKAPLPGLPLLLAD